MIGVVGINHKSTPVEVREKLAFSNDEAVVFVKHLLNFTETEGAILLSTCNRTEIYFHTNSSQKINNQIVEECLRFKKIDQQIAFYFFEGDDCVRHLFRLTAGMDSMILGEYQILGQVKDAFRLSNQHDFSSSILNRLFHKAFEAGKKIRNLYSLQAVPLSAGSAAVTYVKEFFLIKEKISVLVLGAGQMAETVLNSLQKSGFTQIQLYNRSLERAEKLAARYNVALCSQELLSDAIASADLIFAATAALSPVLTSEMLANSNSKKVCFDLAVPRNIEPSVGSIGGISLFTIDHLNSKLNDVDALAINIGLANDTIEKLLGEFNNWLSSQNLSPVIELLQQRFDAVLEQRLQYLKTRVSEKELNLVEQSGNFIKEKYLRNIIASFRELSEHGRNPEYVELMERLVNHRLMVNN